MSSSIGERIQMVVETMTRYRLVISPRPWRAAVELVQKLTGEGAVRSRRLVEAGELEVEVEPWAAPWIALAIALSGAEVEVEPALPRPALAAEELPAQLEPTLERWAAEFGDGNRSPPMLAYDPTHPLGADQPLWRVYGERPESGGGRADEVIGREVDPESRESLTFSPSGVDEPDPSWRCIVERGRLGDWERHSEQSLDGDLDLDRQIERQVEDWRARGLSIAADPVELIAHFSARNLALEAEINRAEDPSEARQVYADWLSERGDPRGRVGQIELALGREQSAIRRLVLTTELDYLLRRRANHLVAALPGHSRWLRSRLDLVDGYGLGWPEIGRILEFPTVACIRSLTLGGPSDTTVSLGSLVGLRTLVCSGVRLEGPIELPHLRKLAIQRLRQASVSLGSLAGLHTLTCGQVRLEGPVELPHLRTLLLDQCPEIGVWLRGAQLPVLETLTIRTSNRMMLVDGEDFVTDRWSALLALLPMLPMMAWLERLVLWQAPSGIKEQLHAGIVERHGRCPEIDCTNSLPNML